MYEIKKSSAFKKDYKKLQHSQRIVKELKHVIGELAQGNKLQSKYYDHALQGKYKWLRDCHIAPDIILIYEYIDNQLILSLIRIGSHSKLF